MIDTKDLRDRVQYLTVGHRDDPVNSELADITLALVDAVAELQAAVESLRRRGCKCEDES